jgi:tetratricopeptide (TPR) repeat protein
VFWLLLTTFQSARIAVVLIILAQATGAVAQSTPSKSERDAYDASSTLSDVQARIKALELFLEAYPGSMLKEGALESLATAYRQSGSLSKEQDAVQRLLGVNPNNLYGLTLKANAMLLLGLDGRCDREMAVADRGLRVLSSNSKPDFLSDAEFLHQRAEAGIVFHSLAGLAAIKENDNQSAQEHYAVLVEMNPSDFGFVYPLALTYLNSKPPDMSRALFFLARAATLSPASARPQIEKFARGQYEKYHGSTEGWTSLLDIAKTNPLMPPSFTITPAHKSE